jgi:hypothetical protein
MFPPTCELFPLIGPPKRSTQRLLGFPRLDETMSYEGQVSIFHWKHSQISRTFPLGTRVLTNL